MPAGTGSELRPDPGPFQGQKSRPRACGIQLLAQDFPSKPRLLRAGQPPWTLTQAPAVWSFQKGPRQKAGRAKAMQGRCHEAVITAKSSTQPGTSRAWDGRSELEPQECCPRVKNGKAQLLGSTPKPHHMGFFQRRRKSVGCPPECSAHPPSPFSMPRAGVAPNQLAGGKLRHANSPGHLGAARPLKGNAQTNPMLKEF